jgi:hypothetical protein
MQERRGCFMPRAKNARGEVRGALPARGTPPETPARFPFCPIVALSRNATEREFLERRLAACAEEQ